MQILKALLFIFPLVWVTSAVTYHRTDQIIDAAFNTAFDYQAIVDPRLATDECEPGRALSSIQLTDAVSDQKLHQSDHSDQPQYHLRQFRHIHPSHHTDFTNVVPADARGRDSVRMRSRKTFTSHVAMYVMLPLWIYVLIFSSCLPFKQLRCPTHACRVWVGSCPFGALSHADLCNVRTWPAIWEVKEASWPNTVTHTQQYSKMTTDTQIISREKSTLLKVFTAKPQTRPLFTLLQVRYVHRYEVISVHFTELHDRLHHAIQYIRDDRVRSLGSAAPRYYKSVSTTEPGRKPTATPAPAVTSPSPIRAVSVHRLATTAVAYSPLNERINS